MPQLLTKLHRLATWLGILLILFGLGFGLYCMNRWFVAQISGFMLESEMPVSGVPPIMSCPAAWATGHSAPITVSIMNRRDQPMGYTLSFQLSGGLDPISMKATIPALQRTDVLTESVQPSDTDYVETVIVRAIADDDSGKQPWEMRSSYGGMCTIKLSASTAVHNLMLMTLLSPLCSLLGAALWVAMNRHMTHMTRKKLVISGIAGLLVILIEALILYTIFAPYSFST